MNSEEIIEVIRRRCSEENITLHEFCNYNMPDDLILELESIIGPWPIVSEKRTHPDEYQFVLYIENHKIYLAIDGDYSSWGGVDLSNSIPYEVVEDTKTIKYWKAV